MSWGNNWDFANHETKCFDRYYFAKKAIPQIRELLSNYGSISITWFDTPQTVSRAQSEELRHLVRKLQLDCLVNSRVGQGLGAYGSLGDNISSPAY